MGAYRLLAPFALLLAAFAVAACDSEQEEVPDPGGSPSATAEARRDTIPPSPPPDAGTPIEPGAEELARAAICPNPAAPTGAPSFWEVRGVEIPIAAFMTHSGTPTTPGDQHGGIIHTLTCGKSTVSFSEAGIVGASIQSGDEDAFAETMEVLSVLGWVPTPTQPPVRVGGVEVPIPQAGHHSTGTGSDGIVGIHLGESWILFNEAGVRESRILPEHEEAFAPTLEAIAQLSPP